MTFTKMLFLVFLIELLGIYTYSYMFTVYLQ